MAREAITAVCLDAGNTLLYCDPPPPVIYADHLSRHGLFPGEPCRCITSLLELLDIVH